MLLKVNSVIKISNNEIAVKNGWILRILTGTKIPKHKGISNLTKGALASFVAAIDMKWVIHIKLWHYNEIKKLRCRTM